MSNQDPYGSPPPQPTGQQPFGQQPYGAAAGFGGPGYPPPPPQKKTGLIIGAIVAALVVIGGLAVGGILLLGDDDKSETASDSKSDEPSEEPSDEESDEPTEEPTDEPDGGDTVSGTNYSYSLPGEQWTDATASITASGTAADSGVVWGESLEGARANVLVEAGSADGTSLDDQRGPWETNLSAGGGPKLERLPDVVIDGEPAYAVQRQGENSSGQETFQTVYLTLHQDIVYSIAFTSLPADDKAEEAFDVVKASWAWTS